VGKADNAAAVLFFQRAVRLDPNFAMAYASLGAAYSNLGEVSLAAENARKAYERAERISDREGFYIESLYLVHVTGNLGKASQAYELWAQAYPRDIAPRPNLGFIYWNLGKFDEALAEFRETLRLDRRSLSYAGLVHSYITLNRLKEARTTAAEAQSQNFDSPFLRFNLYQLAFLENDAAEMSNQFFWAAGKPEAEHVLLASEGDTAAYFGRLEKAREFLRRAVVSAERAEVKETAASYEAAAALREGLLGNVAEARERAAAALALSMSRDAQYVAALALVFAGDATRIQAEKLADDLSKRFPEDTIVQFNYLPTIHAELALSRGNASKAIEALQLTTPYELGEVGFPTSLYPVYVRGEAYLAAHRGGAAAAEFQKILDHRGVVFNEPIGALAHLGLARAWALQGDTLNARATYQDFLTLWKDGDPEIPILKEAKAECAELQ
jgi:tetratricopeptide (TPR) repeat protein